MSEKKYNWIKVADAEGELEFNGNGLTEVLAEEKRICMARHGGELFAFAQKCPHSSGFMVEGYIDPLGNVVCPLHRYKFSLKNGRNVSGEGYYLKHWPVEVRKEGVFVGFEVNKLFGLF